MVFTLKDSPAEIIMIYPQASDLFKENKIDFCCGGEKPLQIQCFEQNIDEAELLAKLNGQYLSWKEAGNVAKDWDQVSIEQLIDFIIHHHHLNLKRELPALSEFVKRIHFVHGDDHPHLKVLDKLYHDFKVDMEEHMMREEGELFPLIFQYIRTPDSELLQKILQLNAEMEQEHDESGDLLKQMREITKGFVPPEYACGTYRVTYDRLAQLEENTFQHIHLENNILFKRLGQMSF